VCRALGAERRPSVGPRGWAHGSDDDGTAPFAVEVKRTTRLQLRAAWIAQARRNAKASGRPWLLVIGEQRSPRPVAVIDFYELVTLAQDAGRLGEVTIDQEGGSMRVGPYEVPEPPTEPPPDNGDEGEGDETD